MTHAERRQRRLDVIEAVKGGMTVAEAAHQYGLSVKTAYAAVRGAGTQPATRPVAVKTLQIIGDLCRGETGAAVAAARGVTKQWVATVRLQALEAGIPVPEAEREGSDVAARGRGEESAEPPGVQPAGSL